MDELLCPNCGSILEHCDSEDSWTDYWCDNCETGYNSGAFELEEIE
jgi:predicted RNA-binding Zn-ribbon protein involved in translation (DUF1610 family)